MSPVRLRIVGSNLPGRQFACYDAVHVGIQRRAEVIDVVPGDAAEAAFDLTVDVLADDGGRLDFRGPHVHGKRGERFLYLSWGTIAPDGSFTMFRRAKIHLSAIDPGDVQQALEVGTVLEGHLSLTDAKGGPVCASIRPPRITWRVAAPTDR